MDASGAFCHLDQCGAIKWRDGTVLRRCNPCRRRPQWTPGASCPRARTVLPEWSALGNTVCPIVSGSRPRNYFTRWSPSNISD